MFSALPFSDAKFELAISVLQPLNFHLAMPNYDRPPHRGAARNGIVLV